MKRLLLRSRLLPRSQFVRHLQRIENGFRLTQGIAFLLTRRKEHGFHGHDTCLDLIETGVADLSATHGFASVQFP